VRRYLPTAVTLIALSTVVGVLQGILDWSNTATNLGALGAVIASMVVFALTAVDDPPHRRA